MENIFAYSTYHAYLHDSVKERSQRGKTKAELAKILGCQAAYLSQVLAGRVELTEEHILRLCEHQNLGELETEYLLVLLRLNKAGSPDLRSYLERQRSRLKNVSLDFEERLASKKIQASDDGSVYYASSFLPSVIHLATSCADLKTSSAIAQRFGLEQRVVDDHLHELERYKLVEFKDSKWNYAGSSLHVSKHSPLDKQMQFARRLLAMNRMSQRRDEDLHYSVIFSADEETLAQLKQKFLESIEQLHKTVAPVEGKDVFAVCIDAFHA